ncbi:hypothetical protein G6O67_005414 [Ophiocordyceps sinensis]|uniref:Uncharacterized protein n=2 Tax=Ophiocordyceps sinensis TaxID=72228 RepID=A0A8H4PRG0_9HYPO|nr:hypothetical protein OCS_03445 [Ophiocordyceps sinensis CO18]KAF4509111.1 hypothetical protein G6O67_005414 [Ophiocordyceps sinensis]
MDAGSMTILAYFDSMPDPWLTDAEIINTFSVLEHEFFEWHRNGVDTRATHDLSLNNSFLRDALHQRWPDQHYIMERYLIFSIKWNGRHLRRNNHSLSHEELVALVSSTPCNSPDRLAKTIWMLRAHGTLDLLLGESDFGGTTAGYSVHIGAQFLGPDAPLGNITSPQLLHRVIMAVGQSLDPGLPRETGVVSSDDHLLEEPFCFFQLGALMVCAGQDWIDARADADDGDAGWVSTGYSVVVRLTPDGYPAGPVYAMYNFHQPRLDADRLWATWEEIEWRDSSNDQELPHIRRLHPGCDQRFFMAKIAGSLAAMDGDTVDFDIVSRERCDLVRAKMDGSKIVPTQPRFG